MPEVNKDDILAQVKERMGDKVNPGLLDMVATKIFEAKQRAEAGPDPEKYPNLASIEARTQDRKRARPLFFGAWLSPANIIRGYYDRCCCGMRPGTGDSIPDHWYDGGRGWTTRHFVDINSFDIEGQNPGAHQCKHCDFIAEGGECRGCCCRCCWWPIPIAPLVMEMHLEEEHQLTAPPPREWTSTLCTCQGCCDAWLCWQCQGARQINALHGHANNRNCAWCCLICCYTAKLEDENGKVQKVPSIWLAALINRFALRELHNIDESFLKTICVGVCCAQCSIAQTYREYGAAGTWPGGCCNCQEPPLYKFTDGGHEMIEEFPNRFGGSESEKEEEEQAAEPIEGGDNAEAKKEDKDSNGFTDLMAKAKEAASKDESDKKDD